MGALHSLMCRVDQAVEHGDEARVALEELFRTGHAVLPCWASVIAPSPKSARRLNDAPLLTIIRRTVMDVSHWVPLRLMRHGCLQGWAQNFNSGYSKF